MEVEEGDLIGWTNKLDFLPISLSVIVGRNILIRDLDKDANDSVVLPMPNQGIHVFKSIPLAAAASVAVSLSEPGK